MAVKVWRSNVDFDQWSHTNAGAYNGRLTFGGLANGFSADSLLSHAAVGPAGNKVYHEDGVHYSHSNASRPLTVIASSMQDGEVQCRQPAGNHVANRHAIHWRRQDDSNYYFGEHSAGTMYLLKRVAGVDTILSTVAHAAHPIGEIHVVYGKSTGNDHEFGEISSHAVTVSATDLSLSAAGTWGAAASDPIYDLNVFGMRQMSVATTGVSRSNTFDAGSTTENADVLVAEGVSLNGGSGVVRISAVNVAGAPSFTVTVTLADGNQDTTFATVTGRYWQIEASLANGGSVRSIGFAKGNDTGGGGTTTITYRSGGGGGGISRPKRTYVVLTPRQAEAIKKAFT